MPQEPTNQDIWEAIQMLRKKFEDLQNMMNGHFDRLSASFKDQENKD